MLKLSEAQKDEILPAPFVSRRNAAPSSPFDSLASAQRGAGGGARGVKRVVAYVEPTFNAATAIEAAAAEQAPRAQRAAKPAPIAYTAVLTRGGELVSTESIDATGILQLAIRADGIVADADADGIAILDASGAVVLSTTRAAAELRLANEALAAERSADRRERQAARGPVCKSSNYNRASLWAKASQTRVVFGHG